MKKFQVESPCMCGGCKDCLMAQGQLEVPEGVDIEEEEDICDGCHRPAKYCGCDEAYEKWKDRD